MALADVGVQVLKEFEEEAERLWEVKLVDMRVG